MRTAARMLPVVCIWLAACGLRSPLDPSDPRWTDEPPLPDTEALMRIKNGVIGDWVGAVTVPWTSSYRVSFTFDSYTHYSARSASTSFSALYFGPDEDSPDKRYSIDDVQANGDAVGTIDIYLGLGDTVRNELLDITFSADLNRLQFRYTHCGQYGPLQYDLLRVSR
jgi:predicted small lipoprotein YifL